MRDESLRSTGPTSDDMTTCGLSRPKENGALTSSLAASPASTSPALASVPESLAMMEAVFGRKCTEPFAFYDRESSSWRTSQRCFIEGLVEFSETWPRAGTTVLGNAFLLPAWVPDIREIASLSWVWIGTPSAAMKVRSERFQKATRPNPAEVAQKDGGKPNPEWIESLMGFPIGWSELTDSETPSAQS
jgi:hypothetical protein